MSRHTREGDTLHQAGARARGSGLFEASEAYMLRLHSLLVDMSPPPAYLRAHLRGSSTRTVNLKMQHESSAPARKK